MTDKPQDLPGSNSYEEAVSNVPAEGLDQPRLSDAKLQELHEVNAQILRENEEPEEGFSPTPIIVVFLACVIFFCSGIYLIKHLGGFDPYIYDETVVPGDQMSTGAVAYDPMKSGAKFYKKQCVSCHQTSGQGIKGVYPPLVKSPWILESDERLINLFLLGMQGKITVNEVDYIGQMPAFQMHNDKKIAAALTFVRNNPEWGHNAGVITEEQVAAIRAKLAGRTTQWAPEELLALYPFAEIVEEKPVVEEME